MAPGSWSTSFPRTAELRAAVLVRDMALGRGRWRSRPWRVAERCRPRAVIQELQPLNTLPAASSVEGDRRRTRTLHAPRGADGLSRVPRGMSPGGSGQSERSPRREVTGLEPGKEEPSSVFTAALSHA
ncbi:uncharacterized protein LOC120223260 isoform X2 [Hyaena hyaena]|uniref:uncharacterized protein LOC120223260 isoform X2 n=1 Tax=Hyaena hyaena TaxID=95912 RepID=UPI0019228293|nr:uncharacterized protein LOC120223260 isoform X2 [Hyaena hyaena]